MEKKDRIQRIVIIGATSSMAEHCARHWVADRDVHMTLVGRDQERLDRIAADLRVRGPLAEIKTQWASFLEPASIAHAVDAMAVQGPIDLVLIAQGVLPDQAACQADLVVCRDALQINALSPVLYAEAFSRHMQHAGHGTIVLIGSVAGDRGRKSNYVYGAAKGLLDRYAQGLQHRLAGCVNVVLVKPGPTDTPMTAHLKGQGVSLAPVEKVASQIVAAASKGTPVVYIPRKWRWIMLMVAHLPRMIFNRMNI